MNDGGELRPEWLAVDSPAPKCVAELIICLGFCSQLDKYFVRAQCYPSSGALLRNVPDACCMNLISGFHSCYTNSIPLYWCRCYDGTPLRVWLSCGGKDLQAFLAQQQSVSALLVTLFCSTFLNIVVV